MTEYNSSDYLQGGDYQSWDKTLHAFEVLTIIQLAVTLWMLLSMVIYGTKTMRWKKKAGTSSLSNGIIYIACTAAVGLLVARLVLTEMTYVLPRLDNGLQSCELVSDLANAAYTLSLYSSYFYLWLRQRLIYEHPYVKEKIGKFANFVSKAFVLWLTAVSIALSCVYVLLNSFDSVPNGCVLSMNQNGTDKFIMGTGKNAIVAVALLSTQAMILGLCVYPVFRVKFQNSNEQSLDATVVENPTARRHDCTDFFRLCSYNFYHTAGAHSPIQMAVRRIVVSSFVMLLSDAFVLLLAMVIFPVSAPVALRQTTYDIGAFVNVFCMLATFGFAGKIFTLFCLTSFKKGTVRKVRSCSVANFADNR